MSIATVELSQSEAARILKLEEGHFQELKAIEVSPAKLTKALSAFSNADGGELFVGIDEDKPTGVRTWRGFTEPEAANAHIQTFEQLFPLGQDYDYEFLDWQGRGLVLHITVRKTADVKIATGSIPYVRRGAQSLRVDTPEALERLERNKGLISFEANTVGVPVEQITEADVAAKFVDQVVPHTNPTSWFKKQLLIRDDKPTVAALLLFSDEPQVSLPKRSAIKIYRYSTTDPVGTRETMAFDPITIEGPIYTQVHEAVAKTASLIEEVQVLSPEGLEPVRYPLETLHEIITNAVLHRDYAIADDVHVRIFDNRVEVESPGRLPAHITPANILDERFSRNGVVVRLINKFPNPPNKDVGEGLNTAFAAMKKLKLKDPIIEELPNAVVVHIRHQRLGSPEELIMQYLDEHPEISNKVVRELTGIGSENKVKTIFQRLMKAKQIERVPNKGGGSAAYQKIRRDP